MTSSKNTFDYTDEFKDELDRRSASQKKDIAKMISKKESKKANCKDFKTG